ncbi:DUF4357 domain-containing protein, partial [Ottowia flava]
VCIVWASGPCKHIRRGFVQRIPSGYQALFEQLVAGGVLAPPSNGKRVFMESYSFTSPSAAAAVISGRSANGRIKWTVQGSQETYAEWQQRQLAPELPGNTMSLEMAVDSSDIS